MVNRNVVSILDGPPGTGKTRTLLPLVAAWAMTAPPGFAVLVTAGSNAALDNIMWLLIEAIRSLDIKLDETRLVRFARGENIKDPRVFPFTPDGVFERKHLRPPQPDDGKAMADIKKELVSDARIIFATLEKVPEALGIKDAPKPCLVVQEESSQCTEGMSYVGLLDGVASGARIVLAGDHRQLAPVIKSESAKRAGYGISLHRRIANNVADDPRMFHTLVAHYRAHPSIMFLYNQLYYDGKLECMVDPDTRPPLQDFPAEPVRRRPDGQPDDPSDPVFGGFNSDVASGGAKADVHRVMLLHVDGDEVSTTDGGKANLPEAVAVGELLERIAPQCVKQGFSVLVTTPYAAQRALYEHGAPCHPSKLKRKEMRTRYVPPKKARKLFMNRSS